MTLGPRASYPAPLPAPTRPNLLSSVSTEPKPANGRWEAGIAYRPSRYDTGGSVDPCNTLETKAVTAGPEVVEWDPYVIWSGDQCSTLTNNPEELASGVRADLETQTSHKIEQILFNNVVDGVDFGATHPNVSLSDQSAYDAGDIITPNAWMSVPPVKGFSDMIDAFTTYLGGARGMIHVEKRLLPFIAFYGLAVLNGQRLVTTLGDHIVVPGTGYTGADPEGNASSENYSWIYGTSMVEVLISPIETFSDVNRSTNLATVRAERMVLAHWDRQAHIGLPLCLEDPAGDCSDSGS